MCGGKGKVTEMMKSYLSCDTAGAWGLMRWADRGLGGQKM